MSLTVLGMTLFTGVLSCESVWLLSCGLDAVDSGLGAVMSALGAMMSALGAMMSALAFCSCVAPSDMVLISDECSETLREEGG